MPEGKYALQITLLSPGNRPIPNVSIAGISTMTGGAVKTDANGKAFGFATSNPVTITADLSKFLDLSGNASKSFSLVSGVVNQGTMTAMRSSETQKLFTSSGSFYFSPDIAEYDWSAIGGGNSGSSGSARGSSGTCRAYGGNGGNAGGIINQASITYSNELITYIVGGPGGGKSSVNGMQTGNGASGGLGGSAVASSDGSSGYDASNGSSTTDSFLYPPTNVGGSGGGGGAYAAYYSIQRTARYGSGGSPGGGGGAAYNSTNGSDGIYYGSGGGGGYGYSIDNSDDNRDTYTSGGAGKQGAVGFIWRFKS